ncbi:hypothetical protein [Micromonospora sp. WMMD980]|uniref:hypothetical protein n=1 Tax=Micromonospora sp. WMMD980 TaxID=3016088 RepID=UPI0024168FE7|nr:hypothetical protein [Micromonospora sp. WMMD980]MDG4801713.1 hypothetical protein [Micromonospora sp. WMMD980]
MPWHEQPMELAYAPRRYPTHDYSGEGEIVTIRVGPEVVGHLSRKGWAEVGWLPRPDLSQAADTVRVMVNDILHEGAADGVELVTAWAEILNHTQHDAPKTAPLDGLRGD